MYLSMQHSSINLIKDIMKIKGNYSGNLAPWNNSYTFSIWDDPLSLNNKLGDSQRKILKIVDVLRRETEIKT